MRKSIDKELKITILFGKLAKDEKV